MKMSSSSAGAGTPQAAEHEQKQQQQSIPNQKPPFRLGWRLFTLRHVLALLMCSALSAAGLVGASQLAFALLASIYLFFLSRFAYPTPPPPSAGRRPPARSLASDVRHKKLMGLYLRTTIVVGLLLPTAYIFDGAVLHAGGDGMEGARAAAPHLFLLCSQLATEGVAFSLESFSMPVKIMGPVMYNTRRVFEIWEWVRRETERESGGWRVTVGRALAGANMALWCFNLFGLLLPVFLPKASEIYYHSTFKAAD